MRSVVGGAIDIRRTEPRGCMRAGLTNVGRLLRLVGMNGLDLS